MKLVFSIMAIALLCLTSCKNEAKAELFGEEFDIESAQNITKTVTDLNDNDSVQVVLKGNVESVCQKKGCWMYLEDPENKENYVRVEFLDYGFFVPMNSQGRETFIKGQLKKEITTVNQLQHMAKDEGKSEEEINAIDTPTYEYVFVASGVKMK